MIDLYYWTTPNGHKITIFLEEAAVAYQIVPVNISKGDQFKPEFLAISPNNRMPAIVDRHPKDGGKPISVFELGAILLYLAEKTGKYLPIGIRDRVQVMEWLFWQMGGLGPMAGQNYHSLNMRRRRYLTPSNGTSRRRTVSMACSTSGFRIASLLPRAIR